MPKLKLTLETVTPLFLGGADPADPPELRPPAFRGVMRYWLRAALGGAIGDSDMDALHTLEAAVFGSTTSASPICLRVSGSLKDDEYHILPHKDDTHRGTRRAFSPEQTFHLTLEQLPERGSSAAWRAACAALNLALTCGGVGLRSRRGHGTLSVVGSTAPELVAPSPHSQAGWSRRAKEAIEGALRAARSLARSHDVAVTRLPDGPTQFPCVCRRTRASVYDLGVPSAMDAVREFMSCVPKHPAFGGISPRQASPLWVRPVRIGLGYGLLCTILPSSFPTADYGRIEDFLKSSFSRQRAT